MREQGGFGKAPPESPRPLRQARDGTPRYRATAGFMQEAGFRRAMQTAGLSGFTGCACLSGDAVAQRTARVYKRGSPHPGGWGLIGGAGVLLSARRSLSHKHGNRMVMPWPDCRGACPWLSRQWPTRSPSTRERPPWSPAVGPCLLPLIGDNDRTDVSVPPRR